MTKIIKQCRNEDCRKELQVTTQEINRQNLCYGVRNGVLCPECLEKHLASKWETHEHFMHLQMNNQQKKEAEARKRIRRTMNK